MFAQILLDYSPLISLIVLPFFAVLVLPRVKGVNATPLDLEREEGCTPFYLVVSIKLS